MPDTETIITHEDALWQLKQDIDQFGDTSEQQTQNLNNLIIDATAILEKHMGRQIQYAEITQTINRPTSQISLKTAERITLNDIAITDNIAGGLNEFTLTGSDGESLAIDNADYWLDSQPYAFTQIVFINPITFTTTSAPIRITIKYNAGWTEATLPPSIRRALFFILGQVNDDPNGINYGRANLAPVNVEKLIAPYRIINTHGDDDDYT